MSSVSSSSSTPAFTASGLASGIDTNSIITQLMAVEQRPITTMQTRISTLKLKSTQISNIAGRANTLLGTIKSLRATSVLDTNPFQVKTATLSSTGYATVALDTTASLQNFSLQVQQIATPTKANGQSDLAQRMTATSTLSTLSGGSLTNGAFTIYVNGSPNTITVDTTQTVDDVLSQIRGISGITNASVVNGQVQLDYTSGTTLQIGSHNDTSNFARATQLATATPGATQLTAGAVVTTLNADQLLNSTSAGLATPVTDGTFTINGQIFDTTGKTLNEMVAEINGNSSVNVTASINRSQNRLELIAKNSGSPLIQLQDGTSNFLTAAGLIVGGNTTTSQTTGQNAIFSINGSTMSSTSNSVTSDITGLTGVTINLLQPSGTTAINVGVSQDTASLKTSLNSFVSQLNSLFSLIDSQTDAQGQGLLKGQSSFINFKNSVKNALSNSISSTSKYDTLASVGISTGAVGGTVTANRDYVVDTTKLDAAIKDNPAQVEALFRGANGLLSQVQTLVESATSTSTDTSQNGLFASTTASITAQITDTNNRITAAQLRLEQKQTRLRTQFTAMERIYSQSQSQQSSLTNLTNQLNANKG